MSLLVDRIISEAPKLNGQDFKMLILMATHARNNPPEYLFGRELIQEAMGWTPASAPADRNFQTKIQRLIRLGYLKRTQQGGMYRYATYEFTFPNTRSTP